MLRGSKAFSIRYPSEWVTIDEAVTAINELTGLDIKDYDIYRLALSGRIHLSLYFQSPVLLRKIKVSEGKIKLTSIYNSPVLRLCMLDKNDFLNGRNLIMSTEGGVLYGQRKVFDTPLIGHEYVHVQELLAHALNFSLPEKNSVEINYGITIKVAGELYSLLEQTTWKERISRQLVSLPPNVRTCVHKLLPRTLYYDNFWKKNFFPIHHLPTDAHFVLRYSELEKFYNATVSTTEEKPASSRMSTPLARLFWLSCWNNESIRPLIEQPYKLLSIFEKWAADAGLPENLNGDTLKSALKRGSPPSYKSYKE